MNPTFPVLRPLVDFQLLIMDQLTTKVINYFSIESFLCIHDVVYLAVVQTQLRSATIHRDKLIIS